MAIIRKYNLSSEQGLKLIIDVFNANQEYYGGAHIKCITIRERADWKIALILIKAYLKNDPIENIKSMRYDDIHFLNDFKTTDQLLLLIKSLSLQNPIDIDGEKVPINNKISFNDYMLLPSNNEYHNFPGYFYNARLDTTLLYNSDPLLNYNFPFYPDVYHAIKDWIGFRDFYYNSDAKLNSILIFLPECRARIAELKLGGKFLKVNFEIKEDIFKRGIRLKGRWIIDETSVPISCDITSSEIELEKAENANGIELYLIDSKNIIFDHHAETSYQSMGQERIFVNDRLKDQNEASLVLKAKESGEGEQVEFKPYIEKGSAKNKELGETIIAFANTKGGTIYMGIDDNCNIEGVEKNILRKAPNEFKFNGQSYEDYKGNLRQSITKSLNRIPVIELKYVDIGGHKILLIKVEEGTERPYFDRNTNETFIRKGSNNVIANPDNDMKHLYKSNEIIELNLK